MATKTFNPDRIDYRIAADSINLLSPLKQQDLPATMLTLQAVKTGHVLGKSVPFSRTEFRKACRSAASNASAPW